MSATKIRPSWKSQLWITLAVVHACRWQYWPDHWMIRSNNDSRETNVVWNWCLLPVCIVYLNCHSRSTVLFYWSVRFFMILVRIISPFVDLRIFWATQVVWNVALRSSAVVSELWQYKKVLQLGARENPFSVPRWKLQNVRNGNVSLSVVRIPLTV